MDGRMDRWVDSWMGGWMDGFVDSLVDVRFMRGWVGRLMNLDRYMDE